MFREKIMEIFGNNYGKFIGGLVGFIIGISVLIIGFFKVLFICICIILGGYFGSKIDSRESLVELLDKILPPSKFK
ncbi:DUF2273 domain-containing protein [Dethiothermospora halolimnae]|uniref:DUF2273 domain-containing protein n=1 Tax=Dethiothermospora halolimnae TaxID=3114390 RepID=UPI003CCC1B7C